VQSISEVCQKNLYPRIGEVFSFDNRLLMGALVYTKLQEAKMWTGKCLEQIGFELPKEYQDKAE
jgi:hypothetical protein